MRLIDADALEEEFIHHHTVGDGGLIAKAPTVTIKEMKDELPEYIKRAMVDAFRPKGKWIGDTDYESCQGNYEAYKCSECGYGIDWRKHLQLMCQDEIPEEYREYCCPHCGARMER